MSDFVVFATWESVWSSFASNPLVMGGARDATIGDENSTVDVGANTEFTYTGIPSGSTAYNGPYSLYEFTLSNGGQAVWMAGVGNSGGIVVPLDATAYDTFVNGTTLPSRLAQRFLSTPTQVFTHHQLTSPRLVPLLYQGRRLRGKHSPRPIQFRTRMA